MTLSRSEACRHATSFALAAAVSAAITAASSARAEVVVNEDEYRDWIGRCETETTTSEVVCFIYTGRVAEVEGETLAARLVVGLGDGMAPIVYLDLPDVAEPATGFMLQIDTREPFSGRFSNCSTGWCHTQAAGEIAEELISQFRAGSEATASFILEGEDLRVDIPLSLLGFTAAYDKLLAIHERAAAAAEAEEEEEATTDEAGDQPADDEEATEDGVASPDAASEPEGGEDPADEPTATEPAADEPTADEPAADEPTIDEPATEEPTTGEPAPDENGEAPAQ